MPDCLGIDQTNYKKKNEISFIAFLFANNDFLKKEIKICMLINSYFKREKKTLEKIQLHVSYSATNYLFLLYL